MKIGIVGVPPQEILDKYRGNDFIDLDTLFDFTDNTKAEIYLPKIYCATIKSIIANALTIKLDLIIFDNGYSKCDNGRFVSEILKRELNVPIITTQNNATRRQSQTICESDLELRKKFDLIVDSIIKDADKSKLKYVEPEYGFWGVPPNDFSLLNLFPKETHVFGWARCMEAKVPQDLELEMMVREDLPTVFYAQAFCSKNSLAKYLAKKHNGLYVEVDDVLDNSVKSKIEAYLLLNKKMTGTFLKK